MVEEIITPVDNSITSLRTTCSLQGAYRYLKAPLQYPQLLGNSVLPEIIRLNWKWTTMKNNVLFRITRMWTCSHSVDQSKWADYKEIHYQRLQVCLRKTFSAGKVGSNKNPIKSTQLGAENNKVDSIWRAEGGWKVWIRDYNTIWSVP